MSPDPCRRSRIRPRRAFSLIEIMVVVVIIGMLAAAVAIRVSVYVDKARTNRAKSDLATLVSAIEAFYASSGRYPTNDEGLSVLAVKSVRDPWKRSYQYNSPAQAHPYEVVCYGADGRDGGTGIDADIYSWAIAEDTP